MLRSESAVGSRTFKRLMIPAARKSSQMHALSEGVAERYVVHVGKFRDRGLARLAGDEVAAEVGQFGQRGLILFLDVVEDRLHPGRHLVILTKLLSQRIYPRPVFFHREVQMRPGREPGRTYISNHLRDMNVAARLHLGTDLRQVAVDADHLVLMLDAD